MLAIAWVKLRQSTVDTRLFAFLREWLCPRFHWKASPEADTVVRDGWF
jgi:hypothetical protein